MDFWLRNYEERKKENKKLEGLIATQRQTNLKRETDTVEIWPPVRNAEVQRELIVYKKLPPSFGEWKEVFHMNVVDVSNRARPYG